MAERTDIKELSKASKYPWGDWLDGSVWRLRQGDDFESLNTFRAAWSREAKVVGKIASCIQESEGVYLIQARPREATR